MGLIDTLAMPLVMGLSILVSLPIVLYKTTDQTRITLMNSIAIGILIFLVGDIFSSAAGSLHYGTLLGYGPSSGNDLIFFLSLTMGGGRGWGFRRPSQGS